MFELLTIDHRALSQAAYCNVVAALPMLIIPVLVLQVVGRTATVRFITAVNAVILIMLQCLSLHSKLAV
jgi:hypothetical protein